VQTIVTDDRGVCLSVSLSVNSASLCTIDRTDQDLVRGEHSWGPKNIALSAVLISQQRGGVGKNFALCEPTTYLKIGSG